MADEKNLNEEEEMTVTLTLDDDSEIECVVLNIFSAGDREYIALLPMEGAESEEGEVYLYRYSETEDGTPVLDNIMDDDEYEIVADAFDEMLDDQTAFNRRGVFRVEACTCSGAGGEGG